MVYYDSYKYMRGMKENVQYFNYFQCLFSLFFYFVFIFSLFSLLIYLGRLKITITTTYYLLYLNLTVNDPYKPLGKTTNAHSPNFLFILVNYIWDNNKSRRYQQKNSRKKVSVQFLKKEILSIFLATEGTNQMEL